MSKFIALLAVLIFSVADAQTFARLSVHNTGWVPVDTYGETRIKNLKRFFIEVQNANGLQMDRWSVTFRVNGPITNGIKTFPPQKLKYQFSYLSTAGADNGTPVNASSLGLNTAVMPFQISGTDITTQSQSVYDLGIKNYFAINLYYDVIVEAGAYLEEYKSWSNFKVNMIMELRNRKGELMTQIPVSFDLRIMPLDSPPTTPTFGMVFDENAKNVLLEFKTASDYANGVTKTQSKAFSTFSNTPYTVRVNTIGSSLSSNSNSTLPVNALKMQIRENQTQLLTGNINLSASQQNIISSAAHPALKFYDITYSTQAGDLTFFNRSYDQYSGTVVFTMIPQ
ncbi:hypothetical protein [Chryseobacterium sp.]|uniref:hypothetical protein n=1 Tax=Chryseobacterium sp. TaxID=1871047 RepID=UPI001E3053B2|nr:hypothetical protein [Chryseobacterium sp.]